MASNLRVDTILPSTGTSLGIGTASGTTTVTNHLNVTGNLGVAGVLTYEDVTNIDSVGVITARDGLRVTGVTTITGTGEYLLQLNKSDSSAVYTQFTNSTSGTSTSDGFRIGMDSNEDGLVWLREDGNVKFGTDNSERLRIGGNGEIGIGGANYGTSGQVLTSQGSGSAVQWANAGGITHARNYRMHTTVDASGGSQTLTNWEYEDDPSSGHLGSGWALPSSGVFSFPTTGIYSLSVVGMMRQAGDSNAWCGVTGQVTVNNSSYDNVFEIYQQIVQASGSTNQYVNFYGHTMIDVTDTSNVKFKMLFFSDQNEQVYLSGSSTNTYTGVKIIRLGAT